MTLGSKIYVAGHQGVVGSAIVRALQQQGQTNLVTRTHRELDLCDQAAVQTFFRLKCRTRSIWLRPMSVALNVALFGMTAKQ